MLNPARVASICWGYTGIVDVRVSHRTHHHPPLSVLPFAALAPIKPDPPPPRDFPILPSNTGDPLQQTPIQPPEPPEVPGPSHNVLHLIRVLCSGDGHPRVARVGETRDGEVEGLLGEAGREEEEGEGEGREEVGVQGGEERGRGEQGEDLEGDTGQRLGGGGRGDVNGRRRETRCIEVGGEASCDDVAKQYRIGGGRVMAQRSSRALHVSRGSPQR